MATLVFGRGVRPMSEMWRNRSRGNRELLLSGDDAERQHPMQEVRRRWHFAQIEDTVGASTTDTTIMRTSQ